MLIYDLFAGTGSATKAFRDAGHSIVRIELDERFSAEIHTDLLTYDYTRHIGESVEFLWASPPCTSFSVASFRNHWIANTRCLDCGYELVRVSGESWLHESECARIHRPIPSTMLRYTPKSATAKTGLGLLQRTLQMIRDLNPRFWVIENPVGLMRKMPELQGVQRYTITHCQYGDPRRMKPTDLFGVLPSGFVPRACKNGWPCHVSAPRGAKTGTQGLDATDAAMLPPMLGIEIMQLIEREVLE